MSRGKDPAYRITEEQRPGTAGPLAHVLGVVICLAGIVYLGLFIASRTRGFRVAVEERLERALGLPVSLKRVEATAALNLRLEGVSTRDSEKNGRPGLRAREVVLIWSFSDLVRPGPWLRRAVVRGGAISFAPGPSGRWEPATLERLGAQVAQWGGFELPEPAPVESPSESGEKTKEAGPPPEDQPRGGLEWLEQVALEVRGGRIAWWDAEGKERASAEGIELTITPVALPNRAITHIHLNLGQGRVGERQVRDFVFELVRTAEQDIILGCSGEWRPVVGEEPSEPPGGTPGPREEAK